MSDCVFKWLLTRITTARCIYAACIMVRPTHVHDTASSQGRRDAISSWTLDSDGSGHVLTMWHRKMSREASLQR